MAKPDKSLAEDIVGAACSCGLTLFLPDPPAPTPEERIATALEEIADRKSK